MHAFSGDARSAVASTIKPVEAETVTRLCSDAEHRDPIPTLDSIRRVAAPAIPPGEFRHVDHGW